MKWIISRSAIKRTVSQPAPRTTAKKEGERVLAVAQRADCKNYAPRDELYAPAAKEALLILNRGKKKISVLLGVCLLFVALAGGARFYLGKEAGAMQKRYTSAGNRIVKELEGLSKRAGELGALARIGRGVPVINQFSLLTAGMYELLAIRNIQYDQNVGALSDSFFIETGRPASEIYHGGLWTIDAISLVPGGVGRFIENMQAQSGEILGLQTYVSYSSGQDRSGASASQLIRIIFWR